MEGDGSDPCCRNQYVHILLDKFGRKNEEPLHTAQLGIAFLKNDVLTFHMLAAPIEALRNEVARK